MGDESGGGPTSIPEELVSEILCYLPVKSLIRFTTVCKSWFRLIKNDHQFAMKNYLTRTTSSSRVLDNVDYMFDIQRSSKPYLEAKVLLCNPAIQEVLLLPPSPSKNNFTALGFDSINNDYKVIAYPFGRNYNYPCTVDVYSLRRGHWRTVQVSDSQCNFRRIRDVVSSANGRMCNWLATSENTGKVIVSFDMVDDVLKQLPLPKCQLLETHVHKLLTSTRWQACLCCLPKTWDFNSRFIDVWVLKDWIWSKELAVKFPDHEPMRPINFWLNEHELLVAIQKAETEEEEVFHYDLDTQQLKHSRRKGELRDSRGYVESLVSIKNLMSLNHERNKKNDDKEEASGQENYGGYVIREVRRKGVRLFHSFKLIPPSE